ncbi:hypothetical protein ACF1DY_01730 [Streptomyces albus]
MSETPMAPEQRAAVAAQLGAATPATDALLAHIARSVREAREHDHPTRNEDLFCMNLTAWLGERMAPVLRRLVEAEAEIDRLRAHVADLERPAAEAQRTEIRQSYRELVAQAREVGDYEGAFAVVCRLREREEQWKREDAVATRTERSYWVAIAEALNAAVAAGLPIVIDLDGAITDRNAWSVVWDRDRKRWAVAGYDDEGGDR